ncbi:hypothetical protein ACFL28_00890 [Candidatus Omnitrophota bacterium]
MKILFVFDSCAENYNIDRLSINSEDTVYLFSLTSVKDTIDTVYKKISSKGCRLENIETASIINLAAENIRNWYIRFIAELPEKINYKGKSLKEFFAIDKHITLWWFSLIAEKNIYKSDSFNRFAQLDAIINLVRQQKIKKIIYRCKSNKLEEALVKYASENSVRFEGLSINGFYSLIKCMLKISYPRHILFLLHFATGLFLRTWKIKRSMNGLRRPLRSDDSKLLTITPYPNIDTILAKKGIFKNKFYPYLQEALEKGGQDIVWALIYVENNSISFKESLQCAQKFIKNGYTIFFLEEFNTIGSQIEALITMLKNGLKFLRIEKRISCAHIFNDYNFYPLFRDDWYSSFAGYTGYEGILYHKMFRTLLNKVKIKKCLYLCEMHAWEKALIFAKDKAALPISLYGYQHAIVPRMLLNYFNLPGEISDTSHYSIPLPDKMICNGQLPYQYMRDSGWPKEKLSIAEAIRYNSLKGPVKSSRKKNIVLVALSISPEESSSILNVVCKSLESLKNIEVWIKPHPFLQHKKAFELAGLSEKTNFFQIKNEPIGDLLSDARIAITGGSSVSLEALTCGCEVLLINIPDWINMSPVKDIKSEMVKTANSPEEMKQIVIDIFKEEHDSEKYIREGMSIVDEYFCLNKDSDVPHKFLNLLEEMRYN